MKKAAFLFFFSLIAFFGLLVGQQSLQAQVTILFPAQSEGEQCSFVDIPVSIIGPVTLVGVQFTVKWDASELEFVGLERSDFPDIDGNSFGTRRTDEGLLTFLWYDPYLNGVDVSTEKTFFTIRLKIHAKPQSTASLRISDDPTPIVGYGTDGQINNITSNIATVLVLEEAEH